MDERALEGRSASCLLCSKLLNSCVPDSIDERALNLPHDGREQLPSKEALQNSNLCIHAATALGCNVSAVSAQDILDGKVCAAPSICKCWVRQCCRKLGNGLVLGHTRSSLSEGPFFVRSARLQ